MAISFPNNPSIGDEFTAGGKKWTWTGAAWESVISSGGSDFTLDTGVSGNTTFNFETAQAAGSYSISSKLNDNTLDIYFMSEDNSLVGYTNTTAASVSSEFKKIVILGATNGDLIDFVFKPTVSAASKGTDVNASPYLDSISPSDIPAIDGVLTIDGGNFGESVQVTFTGTNLVELNAKSIVRVSDTQLLVTRPDSLSTSYSPYTITAINPGIPPAISSSRNKLSNAVTAGNAPVWVTSSLPAQASGFMYSQTVVATDPDGAGVTYSISSGSLPTGLSINQSTGLISGTSSSTVVETFTVRATDSGGNYVDRQFTIPAALYGFTSHTFTTAGKTARFGPTLSEVRTAYSSTSWANTYLNMTTQGIQEWTVPSTGTYRITAVGAAPGVSNSNTNPGGKGTSMRGDFSLTQGQVLKIAPGQSCSYSDGAGGSFVLNSSNNPLVIAGGGGGGIDDVRANFYGKNASTSTSGVAGQNGAAGGTNGSGGAQGGGYGGGGGAGLLGDGNPNNVTSNQTSSGTAGGGKSFANGLIGGWPNITYYGNQLGGGFGGGGGTGFCQGGGGGYSGGGAGGSTTDGNTARSAGGGGSINNGINQVNTAGAGTGNGYVTIEFVG